MIGPQQGVDDRDRRGGAGPLAAGIGEGDAVRGEVGGIGNRIDREIPSIDMKISLTSDFADHDIESIDIVASNLVLTLVHHRGQRRDDEVGLPALLDRIGHAVEVGAKIGYSSHRIGDSIRLDRSAEVSATDRDMDAVWAERPQEVAHAVSDIAETLQWLVGSDHRHREGDVGHGQALHQTRPKAAGTGVREQQDQTLSKGVGDHVLSVRWPHAGKVPYSARISTSNMERLLMDTWTSSSAARTTLISITASILVLGGCAAKTQKPDYSRPLPPGGVALQPVAAGSEPDLELAYRELDDRLYDALDQSISWFAAPSSTQWFPYETSDRSITHAEALESVERFRELLETSPSAEAFRRSVLDEFRIYESVGWDGRGTVLYTGYYAPEFEASEVETSEFTAPIHRRPADLITHPQTGVPIGQRRDDGSIGRYPTRREIETQDLHDELELVWLETPLDAYVVQVNGSAKLTMPDGEVRFVGYDGKTDRPYTGLGRTLFDRGLIEEMDLAEIYDLYERDPIAVQDAIYENENYVYFRDYDGSTWPSGSLGRKVNARATIATDKSVYPRGGVTFVETDGIQVSGDDYDIRRFMLDQDTGGAIRAPGRVDIYMGEGEEAEILAGGQYAEGRLFYLFLRPNR